MNPIRRLVASASGDAERERDRRAEQDLGKDRRERGAEKSGIDMRGERLPPESGIEINAKNDRPHVDEVLAEEAKSQHQEQRRHRGAGDPGAGPVVDEGRGERQQPGVDATAADAADAEIIGEQRIARRDDVGEAAEQRRGRLEREPEEHEGGRIGRDDHEDRALGRRPRRIGWRILSRHRTPSRGDISRFDRAEVRTQSARLVSTLCGRSIERV